MIKYVSIFPNQKGLKSGLVNTMNANTKKHNNRTMKMTTTSVREGSIEEGSSRTGCVKTRPHLLLIPTPYYVLFIA